MKNFIFAAQPLSARALATLSRKYRLTQKIKDDNFDVDALHGYELGLELGNDGLRVCIVDASKSRCVWLEDYHFSAVFFSEQLLEQLQLIFDEHPLLKAGFWKNVRVAVRNPPYTLVPGSLFSPEAAADYLSRLREESPEEAHTTHHYQHQSSRVTNVFAVLDALAHWLAHAYPTQRIQFVHQTSAFIEGVLQNGVHTELPSVFAYVEGAYLTLVVTRERRLEFCNTFFFATPQDFTYYVVFVMNELRLNPESTRLTLYGGITHDSAIFEYLFKYVRYASFGDKPKSLRFGYTFDEALDHQYFNAYNLYLCT